MIGSGYRLIILCLLAGLIECNRDICGEPHLLRGSAAISSPSYPHPYPSTVECTWTILKPPESRLTLFIVDFDVHDDNDCHLGPCCVFNQLSLPVNDNETINYCGHQKPKGPFHLKKNPVVIKYKTSGSSRARGFNLTYIIVPTKLSIPCADRDFVCRDLQCIPFSMRCDGIPQCYDSSDELGCPNLSGCSNGLVACDRLGFECYDNFTERCNGVKDCRSGIDELDCSSGLKCNHRCGRFGCYTSAQRCDGIRNCPDAEDEMECGCGDTENCSGRLCKKLCNNAKCLHPSLWCDGNDDCGDNSDEENCIRNSLISATIMGCLFCGLMLVIAVMCALRIYSIRHDAASYRLGLPQHIATRLSLTNSISLPAMDDEFFHREPPPAYSVAVGQGDLSMTGIVEVEPSMRRSRTRRNRPTRPLIKPPTPPPSSETSNQSSPSRDSITSSSYLSNDDSTHLIGT